MSERGTVARASVRPILQMDSARHVDLPAALDDRADYVDPAHASLRIVSAARRARDDSRKRVLFVIPTMSGGGAERVFLHLMNELDRARFEPFLAVGAAEGPYVANVRADIPIHVIGAQRARSAVPALVSLIRRLKPDTVLSTLGFNLAVMAGRPFFPRRTRVVLREGNSLSAFLADGSLISRAGSLLTKLAVRSLYRGASCIVCQSDYMLEDLAATTGLPRGKMVRIYNPADIDGLQQSARETAAPRFAGPGPHLLAVGRLSLQKGFAVLLEAFASVVRKRSSATLTILGEGEERPLLEAAVARLGLSASVRLPGFVAEPAPYYAQADLFVSSSLYEGFSNVIIESLALGTPVVATDCPSGNREVIIEGVNGWLARPNDAESLATTIVRALAGLSRIDRESVRQSCADRFSVSRIVRFYEELL